jgi:ribose transport system substrate-binding protein
MARLRRLYGVAGLTSVLALAAGPALADYLEDARAIADAATARSTVWDGPTTGPAAQPGKRIVFVAGQMSNGGHLGISIGAQEAAEAIGWELLVIDGKGTVTGQAEAFSQALASQPDGIIFGGVDAFLHPEVLDEIEAAGIALVGWHSAPEAGPVPGTPMFANVTTDAMEVARVAANFVVADSDGKAGVVIFTDSNYTIALAKSGAMEEVIRACGGCEVLSVEDTPLSEVSNRMEPLYTALMQRFGDRWTHSLGINDLYFDYGLDVLDPTGQPYAVSAGDGSEAAFQRIRRGEYQVGTVPEPLYQHGWQLIDELNRQFAGEEWSGYIAPVKLFVPDNIMYDGGDQNVYDPENGYRDHYKAIWGVQ